MLALIDVRKEAFVGIMYVYFAIYPGAPSITGALSIFTC